LCSFVTFSTLQFRPVPVAQWDKPLLIGHSACLADGLRALADLSSTPGLQLDWTSRHAARLNSQTGTEGLPVSSLNCDRTLRSGIRVNALYTVCSKKSDAKIEITITATNLIGIKYPLSSFNCHLSGANVANFNKIHCTVSEQQLFKKWNSKT